MIKLSHLPSLFSENSEEDLNDILSLIYFNQNFMSVVKILRVLATKHHINLSDKRTYNKYYQRLYRFLKYLESHEIIELKKTEDALLFARIAPKLIDLLKQAQNSNSVKDVIKSIYALPRRARAERIEAIKIALSEKMLDEYDKKEINKLFKTYLEEINSRRIILIKKHDAFSFTPDQLILRYKTRFNARDRQIRNLRNYERVFEIASQRYRNAVHLVLTTDPKRFKSLWHSWRHFSKAFNRFMSYTAKKRKTRHHYIAVYEFTRSGLLHAHIVIFGTSSLFWKHQITQIWQRTGQGSYNFIYALKNENGKFVYARERPRDAKRGEDVKSYLSKYLKKAYFDSETLSLYWTSNKRFFTCSRFFSNYFDKPIRRPGEYFFFASLRIDELEDFTFLSMFSSVIVIYEEPPPL